MKTRFVAGMAASIALVIFSPFSVEKVIADQGGSGPYFSGGRGYASPGRSAYAYQYPRYVRTQPTPSSGIFPRSSQPRPIYSSSRGYNPYYRNYYHRSHIGSIGRPYVHVRYDHRDKCHPYYHHYHHDERRR